jgi:adenylate cyclase
VPHRDVQLKWIYGLGPALLAALGVAMGHLGGGADALWLDRLQGLLPTLPSHVAIVELDPATIETLGWPLPKELYAAALDALHTAGAKGIGADLFFTDRARLGPGDGDAESPEELLGAEAERVGAVFATYVVEGPPPGGEPPATPRASALACPVRAPSAWAKPLLPGLVGRVQTGHVHASPGPDGTYRSLVPCVSVHDGCIVDLATRLTSVPLSADHCQQPELIPSFRAYDAFARLSFGKLLELTETADGQAQLKAFAAGKIVLLAITDPTLGDFGPTPRSAREPLVTLHANRVDALLSGIRITPISPLLPLALSLGVLALVLWRFQRALALLAAGLVVALAGAGASAAAFAMRQSWVSLAPLLLPVLAGSVSASVQAAWRYLRFNQVLTQAFGMYVAPDVLAWLKETGGAALAPSAAATREVSVLFSDISGYTRLSNSLPAAQVMESLRFYIDEMVAIVQRHRGYVDKINGDGLMVLFGAPRASTQHASEALACAREMQRRVVELNARWKGITGADLNIRVGVATGTAFTGNLGGEGHFEYTAIGRVVNLAARLESKSELGGVLLSEASWNVLSGKPEGAWRDVELKGYESELPVRAWQVPAPARSA